MGHGVGVWEKAGDSPWGFDAPAGVVWSAATTATLPLATSSTGRPCKFESHFGLDFGFRG